MVSLRSLPNRCTMDPARVLVKKDILARSIDSSIWECIYTSATVPRCGASSQLRHTLLAALRAPQKRIKLNAESMNVVDRAS